MGDAVTIRIKLRENSWSKPWGFPFDEEVMFGETVYHFGERMATISHSNQTSGKNHLVVASVGPGKTEGSNWKALKPNGGKDEEFLQFDGEDGFFYRIYHSERSGSHLK